MNHVLTFNKISLFDKEDLGEKIINLSLIYKEKVNIAPSIILTTEAFNYYTFKKNKLTQDLANKIIAYYHFLSGALTEENIKITPIVIDYKNEIERKSFLTNGETNLLLTINKIWEELILKNLEKENKVNILIQKYPKSAIYGSFFNKRKKENELIIEIILEKKGKSERIIFVKNKKIILKNKTNQKIIDEILKIIKIFDKVFYFPKKIDFYFYKNKIYITSITEDFQLIEEATVFDQEKIVILKGNSLTTGISFGKIEFFNKKMPKNEILILDFFGREDLPFFKKALGFILTKKENSHLIKELQKPAIFAPNIKIKIKNEEIVTINATSGEIYKGGYIPAKANYLDKYKTATKFYLYIKNEIPDNILEQADGFFEGGNEVYKLEELANLIKPKKVILNLPTDLNSANKLLGKIKNLRNKNKLNNIFIQINDNSLEGVLCSKKIIATNGLYRKNNFKEFLNIKTMANLLAFDNLTEMGIDVAVFNIFFLAKHFFGKENLVLEKNEEFEKLILLSINNFINKNIEVIIDLTNIQISNAFLKKIIEENLISFLINKSDFLEMKMKIKLIEKKIIL